MKIVLLTAAILCLVATGASAQRVVKGEPSEGSVKEGERLLVDDGTCPKGQIKEIVGGNIVKRVKRQRRCIPRR
jgi:hypothetical protein